MLAQKHTIKNDTTTIAPELKRTLQKIAQQPQLVWLGNHYRQACLLSQKNSNNPAPEIEQEQFDTALQKAGYTALQRKTLINHLQSNSLVAASPEPEQPAPVAAPKAKSIAPAETPAVFPRAASLRAHLPKANTAIQPEQYSTYINASRIETNAAIIARRPIIKSLGLAYQEALRGHDEMTVSAAECETAETALNEAMIDERIDDVHRRMVKQLFEKTYLSRNAIASLSNADTTTQQPANTPSTAALPPAQSDAFAQLKKADQYEEPVPKIDPTQTGKLSTYIQADKLLSAALRQFNLEYATATAPRREYMINIISHRLSRHNIGGNLSEIFMRQIVDAANIRVPTPGNARG